MDKNQQYSLLAQPKWSRIYFAVENGGTGQTIFQCPTDEDIIVALTFDPVEPRQSAYIVTAVNTYSDSVNYAWLTNPIDQSTPLTLFCEWYGPSAQLGVVGRDYWAATYSSVLTQSDLEDIFSGTKHPKDDFSPDMYCNCHCGFGEEYVFTGEETGGYTFDVAGAPSCESSTVTTESILAHEFNVTPEDILTLGHEFFCNLQGVPPELGHKFTVLPELQRFRHLSVKDKYKLFEKLNSMKG